MFSLPVITRLQPLALSLALIGAGLAPTAFADEVTSTANTTTVDVNGRKLVCANSNLDAAGKPKDVSKCRPAASINLGDAMVTKLVEVDGKKYVCAVSNLDAAGKPKDLSLCKAVDSTVNATTARVFVIETSSGKFLCTNDAKKTDGSIDTALCKTLGGTDKDDDDRAKGVCITTKAAGTSTVSDTGAATSGTATSSTKCVVPSEVQITKAIGKIPSSCPGGGSREVTGGFDAATGVVDVTVKATACIDRQGVKHDGTGIQQGTLKLQTGSTTVYDVKLTKTINTTVTFPAGGVMKRACSVNWDGSLNTASNVFKGTSTRDNCTLEGEYRFPNQFVDNLIDGFTISEAP